MKTVAARAREIGLPLVAAIAEQFPRELPTAPADATLTTAPAVDHEAALAQMARRGPDPALLERAIAGLSPVEGGLAAWDLLAAAVLDEKNLASLRGRAGSAARFLPPAGGRFVRVEAIEPPTDGEPQAVHRLARAFDRAHLPTLASYHFARLCAAGYRPALDDLVEVAADVQAGEDLLPDLSAFAELGPNPSGPAADVLALYRRCRGLIAAGSSKQVMPLLGGPPPEDNAHLQLVYSEAALRLNQPPSSLDTLAQITSRHPDWRYAHRVSTVVTAWAHGPQSSRALEAVDAFVARFGNDYRMWYDTVRYAPRGSAWIPELLARLSREAATLPHDAEAWCSLGMICGSGDSAKAARAEVIARLKAQSTL